jgi:hypothetical protein
MHQFNNWSEKDKLFWIDYETNGDIGSPGTPGFIFYGDYAIRYQNDRKAGILNPIAISLEQGLAEAEKSRIAIDVMNRRT